MTGKKTAPLTLSERMILEHYLGLAGRKRLTNREIAAAFNWPEAMVGEAYRSALGKLYRQVALPQFRQLVEAALARYDAQAGDTRTVLDALH